MPEPKPTPARGAKPAQALHAAKKPSPAERAAEKAKAESSAASRRKSVRSALMLDPLLLDKDGRVIARVGDISVDGVQLFSKGTPFARGDKISGWLDAPALGSFDEEFVAVWLTVAWCVAEGPSGWFKAGCEFDKVDKAESARLQNLIDALKAPIQKS